MYRVTHTFIQIWPPSLLRVQHSRSESGAWEIFSSSAMDVLQFSISQGQLRCPNASPVTCYHLSVCLSCTLLLKCSLLQETTSSVKSWLQRTWTPVTRQILALPFIQMLLNHNPPTLSELVCGLSAWWLISSYGCCYAKSSKRQHMFRIITLRNTNEKLRGCVILLGTNHSLLCHGGTPAQSLAVAREPRWILNRKE